MGVGGKGGRDSERKPFKMTSSAAELVMGGGRGGIRRRRRAADQRVEGHRVEDAKPILRCHPSRG